MNRRPAPVAPGPGQESVWDYPRPPRLERSSARLRVMFAGVTLADTRQGYRVLETSHPPVYYLPGSDLRLEYLVAAPGRSFCEFKGMAQYWTLCVGDRRSESAAWSYAEPSPAFAMLRNYFAFYAGRVDACWVDSERVQPQPGDFYGGWVTTHVVGPFKGGANTFGW